MDTTTTSLGSHSAKDSNKDHPPIDLGPVIRLDLDHLPTDLDQDTPHHQGPVDQEDTPQPPPTLFGHRATITQGPDLPQDMDQVRPQAILLDRQTTLVDLTRVTQALVEQEDLQDQGTLDRDPRTPDKAQVDQAVLPATILDKEVLDACLHQAVFQDSQVRTTPAKDSLGRTIPAKALDQVSPGSMMTPELTRVVTTQLFLEHPISITLS